MEKTILHSDLNSFYASVECLYNPRIRDKPVAVCGDPAARHGIVLTKNQIAKKCGVRTGQAIWQAKQACPQLVVVKPNYERYLQYSNLAREIYFDYTDRVENFGIDEAWLDVTGSSTLFGSGEEIANAIRKRIFSELGVTVSIGVSFCKVFAKLGSDYKKPDAVTVFSKENYKEKIWPISVSELLYVGRATAPKLAKCGIYTIGQLAEFDVNLIYGLLGKVGVLLHQYANGLDYSDVAANDAQGVIKSVGNSATTHRDLTDEDDVWITLTMLSESVAARLRENGLKCKTVQIYLRDKFLISCERQAKLPAPSFLSTEIAGLAMEIFRTKYRFIEPLRSIGVRACDLVSENCAVQMSLLYDYHRQRKMENLEKAIDGIRSRHGHFSIQKGIMLTDRDLSGHNPKENAIHPVGLLNGPISVQGGF
ncbi:MAG: DNA polymerase IV [Clostridiales bacterium]|nr:DNA polymerase IV [Clostridiales bacterium]